MAFNTNPGRQEFTASALQTDFIFNFKIFTDTDINVYQTASGQIADDTEDILTLATDYTVSINGDNGGTVTLLSGATIDDAITIVRDLPITREYDYQQSGDFLADTFDLDQDYQTYLVNDQESRSGRFIRLPISTQNADVNLPTPEAQQFLRWNSSGTALVNAGGIVQEVVEFNDSEFKIKNGSKRVRFNAVNLSVSTERTLEVQDKDGVIALQDDLTTLENNLTIYSSLIMLPISTVPSGYLECDGSEISRTTYAELFTLLGETFGAGDGLTTFNIPDFRAEFPRGWDNGRGIDVGRTIGAWQDEELKSHNHDINVSAEYASGSNRIGPDSSISSKWGASIDATGGTETRPRNIAVMFCIKY